MQQKPNKLYVTFKETLVRECKGSHIANIYHHLFSLRTEDDLTADLEYIFSLYNGTDSHFKLDSKNCWFAIWHKSVRQTDYFKYCYQTNNLPLVSDKERAEFTFLNHKRNKPGYSKTEGKAEGDLFNAQHMRFLKLHEMVRRENAEDSITGRLDSILWEIIHVDKTNFLYDLFVQVFDEVNETLRQPKTSRKKVKA